MEPQHEHQQRQQHQGHGQGQQYALQDARGTVRGCGATQIYCFDFLVLYCQCPVFRLAIRLKKIYSNLGGCGEKRQRGLRENKEALTAVDGQVDVAVLCSQKVRGRAAIQAGRLGRRVDNSDGARQLP